LLKENKIQITNVIDLEILTETDLGEYGMYEGQKVPLDLPMLDENKNINENVDYEKLANLILNVDSNQPIYYNSSWNVVNIGGTGYDKGDLIKHFKSQPGQSMDIKNLFYHADKDPIKTKNEIERITNGRITVDTSKGMVRYLKNSLTEAEFKGKKVQLNKPKRGGAGGKKFYVYVKDGDKVKKVSFGDSGGLSTKVNDPKARKAFAARHKCGQGEEKTSPKWWSCRIGRFWKSLGGSKNFSGYW
jgi:hypothetical protein